MQKFLGLVIVAAFVLLSLFVAATPAAADGTGQPANGDTYSYNVAMSLKAKELFPQYAFNPTSYGQYALRYADKLGSFVPDNEVSPEVRMRLSELMATGR